MESPIVLLPGLNPVIAFKLPSTTRLEVGPNITTVGITSIVDEDDMISDSVTALATQQSIKAYVDNRITIQDLDFSGDTGTGSIDLDSEIFAIIGTTNEIETTKQFNLKMNRYLSFKMFPAVVSLYLFTYAVYHTKSKIEPQIQWKER